MFAKCASAEPERWDRLRERHRTAKVLANFFAALSGLRSGLVRQPAAVRF